MIVPGHGEPLQDKTLLRATLTVFGDPEEVTCPQPRGTLRPWLGAWPSVWAKYYAGGEDPRHPWISPTYADLRGLPPILIQVATHEIMLDDCERFAAQSRAAGVDVTLRAWEGMVHCFAFFSPLFSEATTAMNELGAFIQAKLGQQRPVAAA